MYICDFETTTIEPARVWLWGAVDIDTQEHQEHGFDIESFFKWLSKQKIVWFHNLKFDGFFILDALQKAGFREADSRQLLKNQYNTLISKQGVWYCIKINFNGKIVQINDSLKKIRYPVRDIPARFGFKDIIQKGSIDYDQANDPEYKPTQEDVDYCIGDCVIVAKAMRELFELNLTKMTIGSDSLTKYKDTQANFMTMFPNLSLEVDAEIRSAYKGGFTYLQQGYSGRTVGSGIVFDVNSLYPSVMYFRPLPYRSPVFFDGQYIADSSYPLFVQRFIASFKLKEGFIPTIQIKGSFRFNEVEYVRESLIPVELTLTSVDLELFFKHYDVFDITYISGYKFQQVTGAFTDFIDYWMSVKVNARNKAERETAKLILNNCYGKFATNPDVTRKRTTLEDNKVKLYVGEKEIKAPLYIPVGAFITAWARYTTITAAQANYDRFIYADTDSIHLLGTDQPTGISIHESDLGAWKFEGEFSRAKFLRPKRYLEEIAGNVKVTCAGMPDNLHDQVTFENFNIGTVYTGKLQPRIVEGGVILEERTFELK